MTEAAGDPVDSLRRVKEIEEQTEARLSALKSDGEAKLAKLKDEVEAALQAAQAEGRSAREATLNESRGRAEAEASALLAEGRMAAQQLEMKATQSVAAKREKVLGIVVGEFRPDAGKS